ncbi:uncharacterized protein [Lepeophtheirus salmonis]|uniref:Surfeit locus protein 6 homolog [Nasonia vitripennis] n=1 Tax=Lepeophtheirus salmonis TaxID=72036 RepID=A0A0K2TVM6_LEPSM|nr:surfeit locus protein 6 homolog [Lepeophtheirus salmonis]
MVIADNSTTLRSRLVEDNAYISNVLSLIHIPKHKLAESDDEEVGDVPYEIKKNLNNQVNRVTDINELRQRLKDKLESLKSGAPDTRKAKLSKKEKKKKALEERKAKAKLARMKELSAQKDATSSDPSSEPPSKKLKKSSKPVYNSDGKVVFSKFDFSELNGNKIQNGPTKKTLDPKAALKKIQSQKEKLQSLKEKGKGERVKEIEEENVWKAAINKLEGVKVKDDEALLKKTVKKIDAKKKSTVRKWDKRVDDEEKRKDAHQKKRTENIQKRKKEKKDKKIKKAVKRGRAVPGFT